MSKLSLSLTWSLDITLISHESRFHVAIQIKLIETFKLISKVFEQSKGRQNRTLIWIERLPRHDSCHTSVCYAGSHLKRRDEEHIFFHLTINLSFLNFRNWFVVTKIDFHFNCFLCFPASHLVPATIWKIKDIPSFVLGAFIDMQVWFYLILSFAVSGTADIASLVLN